VLDGSAHQYKIRLVLMSQTVQHKSMNLSIDRFLGSSGPSTCSVLFPFYSLGCLVVLSHLLLFYYEIVHEAHKKENKVIDLTITQDCQ